jgi:hypothetical protein
VEPEDYPDKRGALIGEFQNYLGILKVWHTLLGTLRAHRLGSKATSI